MPWRSDHNRKVGSRGASAPVIALLVQPWQPTGVGLGDLTNPENRHQFAPGA